METKRYLYVVVRLVLFFEVLLIFTLVTYQDKFNFKNFHTTLNIREIFGNPPSYLNEWNCEIVQSSIYCGGLAVCWNILSSVHCKLLEKVFKVQSEFEHYTIGGATCPKYCFHWANDFTIICRLPYEFYLTLHLFKNRIETLYQFHEVNWTRENAACISMMASR